MKNLNMIKHTALVLSLLISLTTTITQAQNFWELATQKSSNAINDTNCTLYNAEDVTFEWKHLIGKGNFQRSEDIAYTVDGNLIVMYDNILLKMEENGTVLWQYEYFMHDSAFYGEQLINIGSDYYLSGIWGDSWNRQYGIMKVNKAGKNQWIKKLYEFRPNGLKASIAINPEITAVENNNFVITIQLKEESFISKFDSAGNKLWEVSNADLNYESATMEWDFLFANNTYYVFNNYHYSILDKNGNILIQDSLENQNYYYPKFINNHFYFTGYNNNLIHYLLKYDNQFNLVMEYTEENNQNQIAFASDIKVLNDESILIFYDYYYQEEFSDEYDYNFNLRHINKNGNCISVLNLYEYGSQFTKKLLMDKSENIILFGHGNISYLNQGRVLLAKLSREYDTGIADKNSESELFTIYPNPFVEELNLDFTKPTSGILTLFSNDGKMEYTKTIRNSNKEIIELNMLKAGIYYLKFKSNENTYVQKVIKY